MMTTHDDFIAYARESGEQFLEHSRDEEILIVGHIDTDGLCTTAILVDALEGQGYKVRNMHVQHINEDVIGQIQNDEAPIIMCADIGSGFLDELTKLENKSVYVIDHHEPKGEAKDVVQINPRLQEVTENNSISGSGVAYFFSLGLHPDNKGLAYIAVIGALGDAQMNRTISPLNERILNYAVVQKTVRVGRRLKLHGIYSRPLTKVLEYSSDLQIPGVTNNAEGVLDLLDELHIQPEWKGRPRKFFHLNTEEKKALTRKIIELKDSDDVFTPTYNLMDEPVKQLRDLREYATILNACGRLEQYDVGIDAVLGNDDAKEEAVQAHREYKKKLWEANKFVRESDIEHTDNLMVVNFENELPTSIVGIVASMIARNRQYPDGMIACVLARDNKETKISLRVSHDAEGKELNRVLSELVEPFDGIAGGHDNAAGAVIATEHEEAFITSIKEKLA
jgi:RecJ-like exonuclease